MSPDQLKLVIDSIIWAFRHTERNIAETGWLLCVALQQCRSDVHTAAHIASYVVFCSEQSRGCSYHCEPAEWPGSQPPVNYEQGTKPLRHACKLAT